MIIKHKDFEVGDVVIRTEGVLHCGTYIYTHAICVSLEPFTLISDSGDMLWLNVPIKKCKALCKADKAIRKAAMKRWARSHVMTDNCEHEWKVVHDWIGDSDVVNGTCDISYLKCIHCEEVDYDTQTEEYERDEI